MTRTGFTECGECKFYQDRGEQGACMRYPPSAHLVYAKNPETGEPQQLTMSVRPPVTPQEFCGEGVPRLLV